MYYVVNVAQNMGPGWNKEPRFVHLFATAKHSCTNESEARNVFNMLRERFPAPEFKISVTRWEERGYGVEFEADK